MYQPVGIRSLAVSFPSIIRTNDYYKENYPDLIAGFEEKIEKKTLSEAIFTADFTDLNEFEQEMLPYLSDPFRGTLERRVMAPGETSLTLSYRAAEDALLAANLSHKEIDLMLVATTFPEQILPGNAVFLAGELGLQGAAWNIESTCSSAIAALQSACAMVRAGEYRNVLVVTCNNSSGFMDENNDTSFLSGDGAGAFVVSKLKGNQGVLSTKIINTASTCGSLFNEFTIDAQGNPRMYVRMPKGMRKVVSEISVKMVRECCLGAVNDAGVTLADIDFFAFPSALAWYANFCASILGIDIERTINLNNRYANIGPTLPLANLYHCAELGRIRENSLVLVYGFGAVANAGASVMRWGDVALGTAPALPVSIPVTSAKNQDQTI